MNLINELGTDLALAFLVEQRYREKIDSDDALALIGQVRSVLESASSEIDAESSNRREKSAYSSDH
jgi:hypothetical protein